MTAVVIFVFGVLLILGFVVGLSKWRRSTKVYTGEMMNQLFATVDRIFRRRLP
jgi:hypothetical protein